MSELLENLPKDWELSTLGALNSRKAPTINPKDFADETFEYYSIPDFQRDQRPSLTKGGAIESSKLLLKPKTVLFGKLNPRVEKVWRVTESLEFRQIGSTEWITILPNEAVDADFLYFLEWSDHVMPIAKTLVSGSTPSRQRVDPTSFYRLRVPVPPLPEQKKIAQILSTVQRAIEAQERIIQTTTELKKALMHKLFTEGLRNEPQKQTEIGPVPESWEVVEIGDLGKRVTGSTPKTKVASFYDPPSEDFIAPADLGARRYVYDSEKKISPEGMATIRPIPKNAVMCVCIGSSIGKVGMSYREESATNQQINSIICDEGRDPEFVYYLLSYRSDYWKSFATFGPVPILSKGRFSTIVVPIPSSLDEQKAIAKPLVALETKVEVAEKKVTVLKDLFRTLLHELMTAKTRVHELELPTSTIAPNR